MEDFKGSRRIDVDCAPYTCEVDGVQISGSYAEYFDMDDEIEDMQKKFKAEGIEIDSATVKNAIKDGFARERRRIQEFADEIANTHDLEKVERTRLGTYNTNAWILGCTLPALTTFFPLAFKIQPRFIRPTFRKSLCVEPFRLWKRTSFAKGTLPLGVSGGWSRCRQPCNLLSSTHP